MFFQYSLCRVVLMVRIRAIQRETGESLSVLALSSRFDGPPVTQLPNRVPPNFQYSLCRVVLMVRGSCMDTMRRPRCFQYSLCRVVLMVPWHVSCDGHPDPSFQYSLCRVVLMVPHRHPRRSDPGGVFQYSLCRVVLMVHGCVRWCPQTARLSVLALSSRFDGPGWVV